MQILDGKEVSKVSQNNLKKQVHDLIQKTGKTPCLAVILVGDDPASHVYVKNKIIACHQTSILSKDLRLPSSTSMAELKQCIETLNQDSSVHGLLVQFPLPSHLNKEEVLSWVDPLKDADGLTTQNLGFLFAGRPRVVPCTPMGVMQILKHYSIELAGKNCVVVGRSQIVGLPMAHLLLQANATVSICHSKTQNLSEYTKKADVVVVAAGRPEFLGKNDFNSQAVVIDVGIHRKVIDGQNKLCGDVNFNEVKDKVKAITPVPGGVGPMTIAMLLKNTVELFKLHNKV